MGHGGFRRGPPSSSPSAPSQRSSAAAISPVCSRPSTGATCTLPGAWLRSPSPRLLPRGSMSYAPRTWVVYCKPPFAGPEHVLACLGRYTHRIALSNDRLLAVRDGRVRLRWRDYADGDRVKVMALDVDEFLRRFLLHVVPDGFVRIRHFGLLANRRRAAALAQCRTLLAQPAPPTGPPESARAFMLRLTGIDIERCPSCQQGVLRPLEVLPPAPATWDTS